MPGRPLYVGRINLNPSKNVSPRVAPMGAPRRAQLCEHGGGNRRQDPRQLTDCGGKNHKNGWKTYYRNAVYRDWLR